MKSVARLRDFVTGMTRLVERHGAEEARMLDEGERLLRGLVSHDDWLPDEYAAPSPESYRQYLLYCDPLERFSVVSFVWMPGHRTPIHDHTVWGLVGVMRGEERCDEYSVDIKKVNSHDVKAGRRRPRVARIGDVHVVSNAGDADRGEHPRLRRQYRRGAPPYLRPRDRQAKGIRVRLSQQHRAEPVGPLEGRSRLTLAWG